MSTFPGAQPASVVAALDGWRRRLRRRPRRCTFIEDNRRCAQHRRSDQRPYGAVSHYRSAHAPGLTTPRRGSMSPRLAADPFLTASKQQRCSASPDNGCRCLPRSAPTTSTPDTSAAIGRARPKPLAVHEAIELLGYTSHSGGTSAVPPGVPTIATVRSFTAHNAQHGAARRGSCLPRRTLPARRRWPHGR